MGGLLHTENSLLLIIDVQEKFKPILFNADALVENISRMVRGCNLLDVPVVVSEQYPKGLGSTVSEITAHLYPETPILEKFAFGCCGEPTIETLLTQYNRKQIMICGIEAHICVNQTVVALLQAGYDVHLIEDAIGTRHEHNYHIALQKLTQLGALPSCVEMALFELMGTSKHPRFKEIQALVL